jgi:hypothetical protein
MLFKNSEKIHRVSKYYKELFSNNRRYFQSFSIFIIGKGIIFILIVSQEDIEELENKWNRAKAQKSIQAKYE